MKAPTDAQLDALAAALIPTLERVATRNPYPLQPGPKCRFCEWPARPTLVVYARTSTQPAGVSRQPICTRHAETLARSAGIPAHSPALTLDGRPVYAVNPPVIGANE